MSLNWHTKKIYILRVKNAYKKFKKDNFKKKKLKGFFSWI